jgi:hypothetical protein
MRYEYLVDKDAKRAYLSFQGNCSISDMERTLIAIGKRDEFNPENDELVDLQDCTLDFQPIDMVRFVEMFMEQYQGHGGNSAVLVTGPQEKSIAMFHRSRVSGARNIRVFSSRDSALNWLAHPETEPEQE